MPPFFIKSNKLIRRDKDQIKKLFLDYLCKNTEDINNENLNQKMGLFDDVTIFILPSENKESIIGTAFLFLPTKEDLKDNILDVSKKERMQNITEQGIKNDTDVYLYNLIVHEDSRKKGHAYRMLLDIEKEMIKRNKKRILLCVDNDNIKAIALYNKAKYRVLLAIPHGFIMAKLLNE
jgi:GNAT superfamily N-acetyltransferase